MKKLIALLAAGAFLFAGVSHVHAQEAADAGEEDVEVAVDVDVRVVAGSVVNPGDVDPMDLNFEFSGAGESLQAEITVPGAEGMRIVMNELLITDTRFTFSFQAPGNSSYIECDLERMQDDSFYGDCFDDEGTVVPMTIGAFEE